MISLSSRIKEITKNNYNTIVPYEAPLIFSVIDDKIESSVITSNKFSL